MTIYATAANSDLSDVRVRNGVGSLVPHAWLTSTETETQVDSSPVPFFAVPVPARGKTQEDLTLVFKRTTAGTLVIPKTIKTDPERTTTDWIVDAGRVQGHLLQLRLTLEAQAEGLFPLRVEASDDLRRTVDIARSVTNLVKPLALSRRVTSQAVIEQAAIAGALKPDVLADATLAKQAADYM